MFEFVMDFPDSFEEIFEDEVGKARKYKRHSDRPICRRAPILTQVQPLHAKLGGYEFFRSIGSPRKWLAPMVQGSELPFRLLCRRYGVSGTYGPMNTSAAIVFNQKAAFRRVAVDTGDTDSPFIFQLCGHDPEKLVSAALAVLSVFKRTTNCGIESPCCIDLNLGCPQPVARRGYYGSWLQDNWPLCSECIRALHFAVPVPISVKIRLQDVGQKAQTKDFAKMLVQSGAQMVAVHGRERHMRKSREYKSDWERIRVVRESIESVPVIANGGIESFRDHEECMRVTGCDATMSGYGLLKNPALYCEKEMDAIDLALEYLEICAELTKTTSSHWGCNDPYQMFHINKLLKGKLLIHYDIRNELIVVDDRVATLLKLRQRLTHGIPGPKKTSKKEGSSGIGEFDDSDNASMLDFLDSEW